MQTYQGLPQLFQEKLPIPGSPEEYEELLRGYKKYKEGKITEISKEPTEEELKQSQKKIHTVNLDAGLDIDVIEKYGYDKPSKMIRLFSADESNPDKRQNPKYNR